MGHLMRRIEPVNALDVNRNGRVTLVKLSQRAFPADGDARVVRASGSPMIRFARIRRPIRAQQVGARFRVTQARS